SIALCICQLMTNAIRPANTNAPTAPAPNSWRRRLRSASRHGSRLILGISVEAPQCQTARGQQCRCILLHRLSFGLLADLHLTERIAALRFDADSALNHLGGPRDVGTTAADQNLLGLLAPGAGGEEELQRTTHLLTHVVDERSEHFGLVVARQTAFLLGPPSFFHAEAVRAHDFFRQLLPTEGKVSRIDHFQIAQ